MNRWEQGRTVIDALILEGKLDQVPANRDWSERLISLATEHIEAAEMVLELSPLTSFQTSYDALHKLFDAVLINQGLRGTSTGGHLVLQDALRAQLDPPLGDLIRDFGWMRKLRNAGDYPVPDQPLAGTEDAEDALEIAKEFADKAIELVNAMPVYGK